MKILLLSNNTDRVEVRRAVAYLESLGHEGMARTVRPEDAGMDEYDLAISYFYPYIIPPQYHNAPSYGTINVHTSYLPYNRGAHPNVWSIVNDLPAGVTIHWMDDGIDTGHIISQVKVQSDICDTGKTLYEKLSAAAIKLFVDFWPDFEAAITSDGPWPGTRQRERVKYMANRVADFDELCDLESEYGPIVREIIDRLRALTFPPHRNAFIYDENGCKVFIDVKLTHETTE